MTVLGSVAETAAAKRAYSLYVSTCLEYSTLDFQASCSAAAAGLGAEPSLRALADVAADHFLMAGMSFLASAAFKHCRAASVSSGSTASSFSPASRILSGWPALM